MGLESVPLLPSGSDRERSPTVQANISVRLLNTVSIQTLCTDLVKYAASNALFDHLTDSKSKVYFNF